MPDLIRHPQWRADDARSLRHGLRVRPAMTAFFVMPDLIRHPQWRADDARSFRHGLRVKPAMTGMGAKKPAMTATTGTSNNPVERSGTTEQLSTVSAKMESCSCRRDSTEARSRTVFLFGQVLDKKGENGGCPQRGRSLI